MKKTSLILAAALAAPLVTYAQASPEVRWLLPYQGDHENALVNDARFEAFLRSSLKAPQHFWDKDDSLADVIMQFLGVPGMVDVDQSRYWDAYGCVPHDCGDTGLLWVDTGRQRPLVIFAAMKIDATQENHDRLLLFPSEPLTLANLPLRYKVRVTRFINETTELGHTLVAPLSGIDLIEPDGTEHEYRPADLAANGK